MKLFFQLQWQQSRTIFLFLIALSCIAPFLLTYSELSEMQLIMFVYIFCISSISAPVQIIASRDMFDYLRTLPLSNKTISTYFIYSQTFFIIVVFVLVAPHHFYAAHVQHEWSLFTLSFCTALCVCLISHAVLLPSMMRKMKSESTITGFALTVPIMVVCYFIAFGILTLFSSYAVIILFALTAIVLAFYVKQLKKYTNIHIYENSNI